LFGEQRIISLQGKGCSLNKMPGTIPFGKESINRKPTLKKFLFLLIFVVVALALDGTLAKDIFDYGIQTVSGWLGLALGIGIFITLLWAESTKSHHDKNTHE
jgi:hypothetical protein